MCILRIYLQMLSVPCAFPDFICCIACCITSCSVGTSVALSRSSFDGGGGFRSYGNSIQNFKKVFGPSLNCGFDDSWFSGMESSLLWSTPTWRTRLRDFLRTVLRKHSYPSGRVSTALDICSISPQAVMPASPDCCDTETISIITGAGNPSICSFSLYIQDS